MVGHPHGGTPPWWPTTGQPPWRPTMTAASPLGPLNACRSFVGILAEARFKADNEVLQMLAGNSSQTLLERCTGESAAAAPGGDGSVQMGHLHLNQ